MSQIFIHDIIKLWDWYMCECCIYAIIKLEVVYVWILFILYYKMIDYLYLNPLYIILLEFEMLYVWMPFILYFKKEGWYMSECSLYYILKKRDGICLNALYLILLKWELLYLNDICMILMKWEKLYIWMLFM